MENRKVERREVTCRYCHEKFASASKEWDTVKCPVCNKQFYFVNNVSIDIDEFEALDYLPQNNTFAVSNKYSVKTLIAASCASVIVSCMATLTVVFVLINRVHSQESPALEEVNNMLISLQDMQAHAERRFNAIDNSVSRIQDNFRLMNNDIKTLNEDFLNHNLALLEMHGILNIKQDQGQPKDVSEPIPVASEEETELTEHPESIIPVEFEMVPVPAGASAYQNASPGNHVFVESFMIAKYETTNAQFAQYLNDALASGDIEVSGNYVKGTSGQNYYRLVGPGRTVGGATTGGKSRISHSGGTFTVATGFDNHPVTYVSWYGATAFASYYGWRLPTEEEWRAVASFTDGCTYATGNSLYDSEKFLANYLANGYDETAPNDLPYHPWVEHGTSEVGYFGTFGYGLADMSGNVWEWTSSVYGSSRVIHGGGWNNDGSNCTVSHRSINFPHSMSHSVGFRVCR